MARCLGWLVSQGDVKPAFATSWLGLCIMFLVYKTVHPEREEMQTHRRKESSWEFSLKHSFKLLCNIASETEESMQKVGTVGVPAWVAVSPSCGTHEGFTVVSK